MNIINLVKKQNGYFVKTSEGREQPLNPETLDSDASGCVTCAVKNQETPIAFDNGTKEKLIRFSKERDGYRGLMVKGLFYPFMIAEEKGLGVRGEGLVGEKKKKIQRSKKKKLLPQKKKTQRRHVGTSTRRYTCQRPKRK